MEVSNQSPTQAMVNPQPSNFQLSQLLSLVKDIGPWFYGAAVGTIYVSGFLVLNSNLAKSGVLDIEFIDARYFLAGANFAFFWFASTYLLVALSYSRLGGFGKTSNV